MKKIIAYMIIAAAVLQLLGAGAFAAENMDSKVAAENIDNNTISDAMAVLSYIHVIDDTGITEEALNDGMTRADFAVYISKMIKMNGEGNNDVKNYYYDIPKTHWGKSSINVLTEMFILNGESDGKFRPDEEIMLSEAVKILVSLLGYRDKAEAAGGYPYGYRRLASNIGLFEGISPDERLLNCREGFILIYNALNADLCNITTVGKYTEYKVTEGKSILSEYYDVFLYEGQIRAVKGASIDGNTELNIDEVKIGSLIFKTNEDLYGRLGETIRLYYYRNEKDADNSLVHITGKQITDSILALDGDDILEFSGGNLKYYNKSGKRVNAKISSGASVVVNGRIKDTELSAILNSVSGRMRLYSVYGKEYDTIIIENYVTMVVENINFEEKRIYGKYNSGFSLNLEAETVKYYLEDGLEADIGYVSEDGVISAVVSEDGETIVIYVCGATVNGRIDAVSESEGSTRIIVNGQSYEAERGFKDKQLSDVKIGDEGTLKLDLGGKAAYFESKNLEDMKFGMLIDGVLTKGFDRIFQLKMMTEEGNVAIFECAKHMKIDGASVNNYDAAYTKLSSNGEVLPQIIRYRLSEDNLVKELDTTECGQNESKKSLTKIVTSADRYKYHYMGYLGEKNIVSKATKLFIVPDKKTIKSAPDGWFGISDKSYLNSGVEYTVDIFTDDPEDLTTKLVVVYEDGNATDIPEKTDICLFEYISSKLDDEGNVGQYINVFDGTHTAYKVADNYNTSEISEYDNADPLKLTEGDCIQLRLNMEKEVVNIRVVLDYSRAIEASDENFFSDAVYPSWKIQNGLIQGNFFDGFKCSYGFVAKRQGNLIQWGYEKPGDEDELYDTSLNGGATIIIFDSRKKSEKVYSGAREAMLKEISAYYESDGACSKIIAVSNAAAMQRIVIYK